METNCFKEKVKMSKFSLTAFLLVGCLSSAEWLQAQSTDSTEVEEDYSQYADAEIADGTKRYCTFKVFDQSPNKLISVGYDWQSGYTMNLGELGNSPSSQIKNRGNHGLRLAANFPVVSKPSWLVNVGLTYWETHYAIDNAELNPLALALQNTGLRTLGLSASIFKPLNQNNFLLFVLGGDLNGDYTLPAFQSPAETRFSGTAVYGWKKHDRLLYGFGASRTYRIGEANYIPVFLYNYTFPSRKWGIEAIFPARVNVRRSLNTRSILLAGYELEGQTYRIGQLETEGLPQAELRRSELRARLSYEQSLKDFIWISFQAGFRYDWNINLDNKELFRGFGEKPYTMENDLSNAWFFSISLNLVSP